MSRTYTQVDSFVDFTGRSVSVGDEIVFPSRVSSSMWLNKARVLKIEVDNWVAYGYRSINGQRVSVNTPRQDWRISVQVPGNQRVSRLEAVDRIVKVRTAKEIELAEREAEFRATPQRVIFGFDGSGVVPTDIPKPVGQVDLITFTEPNDYV